ncbi:MAG: GNAT family N-acetyltransferase [Pseudomonadota bacterium]
MSTNADAKAILPVGHTDATDSDAVTIRVLESIDAIAPEAWDRCAVPDPAHANPFVRHAFLKTLEDARCVSARTGWMPHHLVLERDGDVLGCAPAYLKFHSQGEYVFDYGWADAFERAGGRYYPKLQLAVPFTPVPGPRLLVADGLDAEQNRNYLAAAAVEVARQRKLSSVHVTFLSEPEWHALGDIGFLQRTDQQFHWTNNDYEDFDGFLGDLVSRKRKAVRKERATAVSGGLEIEWVRGADITEAHWDAFYEFYEDTGSRKWGRPYLNRKFFSQLSAAMPDACLLILAKRGDAYIAGALNMIGGDCLYGRYWGCTEHHPCLHFEICYYQAIDYAIAAGLSRVEAGAQGEHKLARGYLPTPTYSAHWIADGGFRRAVADYLDHEREHVDQTIEALSEYAPFRRGDPSDQNDQGGAM